MEREQLMGKFLYGGVTLPAKPDYDETVFPCAYMQNSNTLIVVSAVGYIIKDTEGNATGMRSADGTNLIYSAWTCDDGETWTPLTVERETSTVAAANVFWSNTDLCYEDGTVYVAASEPVPVVEKFPIREWIGWLLAGLCSRPLPMGARVPVAYLYNGVRLPGLPKEWNPETHPFACLFTTGGNVYTLRMMPSDSYYTTYFNKRVFMSDNGCLEATNVTGDTDRFTLTERTGGVYISLTDKTIWVNFDLVNEDGSIFLAASDPIPVYE